MESNTIQILESETRIYYISTILKNHSKGKSSKIQGKQKGPRKAVYSIYAVE